MAKIMGTFVYNGLPYNGATAKLWPASAFVSDPAAGDAIPGGSPVATVTTGTAHGGDGAYRFTGITTGEYYVSVQGAGSNVFFYAPLIDPDNIPETSIDDGGILARLAQNETVTGNWLFNGTVSLASTLVVGGLSSLASLNVGGNASVGGTFGVTGATTLAGLAASGNVTVGGTLGVTGLSTLASLSVTGNATVGGTLGVTGVLSASARVTGAAGGDFVSGVTAGFASATPPVGIGYFRTGADKNIAFTAGTAVATAVAIVGINNAAGANIPLEFRGTSYYFLSGLNFNGAHTIQTTAGDITFNPAGSVIMTAGKSFVFGGATGIAMISPNVATVYFRTLTATQPTVVHAMPNGAPGSAGGSFRSHLLDDTTFTNTEFVELRADRASGTHQIQVNKQGTGSLRNLTVVQGSLACTTFETDGGVRFGNTEIGFFNANPSTKLAVSGSRGGNAALASLLTQLAAYGLITDSSTA